MIIKNQDIKEYAKENDVKLWQVANALGMTDGNFSKLLRNELSDEKKAHIKAIIDEIKKEN